MLYYYGNNVKEALLNNPVEIETTKELCQYQNNYNVVILANEEDESALNIQVPSYDKPEFIGQIIDVFEDFLTNKGVGIPHNPADEEDYLESGNEDYVNIYGCDYGDLQSELEELLNDWSK